MPLGGVGTGSLTFCSDGRWRDVTINNNRAPDEAIPVIPRSFVAVRCARPGDVHTLILQAESAAFPAYPEEPPPLRAGAMRWRAHYPTAHVQLPEAPPLRVTCTTFSPVLPFDADASSMPCLLVSVLARNLTHEPLEVSALLNWQNIIGHTAAGAPDTPAALTPVLVDPFEDDPKRALPKPEPPDEDGVAPPSRFNGIALGDKRDPPTNAHGQHAVALRVRPGLSTSVAGWDSTRAEDRAAFWRRVNEAGALTRFVSVSDVVTEAAVMGSVQLAPGSVYRWDFAVAWYHPRHERAGRDLGNAYTNRFRDAVAVAQHALRHTEYLYAAVENWQQRFDSSSLPPWLGHLLVDSSHVFSTNSLLSKEGLVGACLSEQAPRLGVLDARVVPSFGQLLFFPRMEETELLVLGNADPDSIERRICRDFGRLTFFEPAWAEDPGERVELGANLVLLTYRNFHLSGKLVRLLDLLPVLERLMRSLVALDADGDGLPDTTPGARTFDGVQPAQLSSITASLWLAALRAYAALARGQDAPEEAERYEALLARACQAFEARYWDEAAGCYALEPLDSAAPRRCHVGQLMGQWYADFLDLGDLLHPSRVARALDTITTRNRRGEMLVPCVRLDTGDAEAPGLAWPLWTLAVVGSHLIYRGRPEAGLRLADHLYHVQGRRMGLAFRQPDRWDIDAGAPGAGAQHRHVDTLGAWHLLYAVQGFLLNVPEARLTLRPNLAAGAEHLSAPLFTPSTFGWLKFREQPGPPYFQRVRIAFDSPIAVRTVHLRVPAHVAYVSVQCESGEGDEPLRWTLTPHHMGRQLTVQFVRRVTIRDALDIQVTAAEPPEPRKTR